MSSPSVSPAVCSQHTCDTGPAEVSLESSPLWPLVTILGEIAERAERRQLEEHAGEHDA